MANFYGGRPGRDFNIDTVVTIVTPTQDQAKTLREIFSTAPFGVLVLVQGHPTNSEEKAYSVIGGKVHNIHNTMWVKTLVGNTVMFKYMANMGITANIMRGSNASTYNDYKTLIELVEGGNYV